MYVKKTKQPSWIKPMLATLTEERFSDKEWIFEKKLDGLRCIAVKKKGVVSLFSRNHNLLNDSFPEIVSALENAREDDFIIDGEIIAKDFSSLQQRMHVKAPDIKTLKVKVSFVIFDVLYAKGYLLTTLPLLERKKILKSLPICNTKLKYLAHKNCFGERYFKEATKKGWEGIIAKKANGTYVSKRSSDWLKFKCKIFQEVIICGFTKPQGSRVGFGALLIGYMKNGSLKYGGKVGSGYDTDLLETLTKKLKKLERKTSPFKSQEVKEKNVHWVEPKLIAKVAFTEWTTSGKLRHPIFLKLITM